MKPNFILFATGFQFEKRKKCGKFSYCVGMPCGTNTDNTKLRNSDSSMKSRRDLRFWLYMHRCK